jgi:hypothetical protein
MGISAHDREIQLLVSDVKDGYLQLPELQRKYVWKSTQVRDFFDSLYHQYPTGQLLVWETDDHSHARDLSAEGIGATYRRPQLLLDGQQRLTSLYAVMTGAQVEVRDRSKPIDIVFNVFSERFDVATAATRPQSGWVSLTRLFRSDPVDLLDELAQPAGSPESKEALKRMYRLTGVKEYRYRVTVLEGLAYDEVTDIFVRINSGGTRLSNADLSLAQISSRWRGVSKELDQFQQKAKALGWDLDDSILLRVLSAIATNQATLSQLFKSGRSEELTEEKLREAWQRAKPAMLQAIQFIKQNCLIDRLSMLPTNYVLVPLAVFFDRYRHVTQQQARDLQRWLYTALIWARYSGSSETTLDQDIKALGDDQPIRRMLQNIEDKVGPGRRITERELQDELSNSPFMLMTYVLARRNGATDWFQGIGIGEGQDLEYHHIFPKALLAKRYTDRAQSRLINQVANLALLSQRANGRIAASSPNEYLPTLDAGRLRAQYVPTDPALWTIDRYEDFARARRELLATAINDLLASMMDEPAPWISNMSKQLEARLGSAEHELRDLIDQRLTANFGPGAWKRCVAGDIQDQVRQRIEQRIRRNPFEEGRYETLAEKLTQCNFGDYAKIIRSNWALFEDVFRDKTTFDRQMVAVQDARNAFAHRREMNEGEQQTAAGSLYWIEQCLRQAARPEPEEEASGEGEGDLVGVTISDRER